MATAKKTTTKAVKAKKVAESAAVSPSLSSVIINPRVTEKATMKAEHSVYTFNVSVRATKPEIVKAVKQLFKVTPEKVHVITIHPKKVVIRGKRGMKAGGKKALVYLKKGDKINFT